MGNEMDESVLREHVRGEHASGVFEKGGSAWWKQRAIYDAIKRTLAIATKDVVVARPSVFDDVRGVRLGTVLDGRGSCAGELLIALIQKCTS
jgi:hypothetical protein